jgi:hypothetical protein
MSGGCFDYDKYKIGYIADEIEKIIERNGRKKTDEELKQFMPHNLDNEIWKDITIRAEVKYWQRIEERFK